MFFSLDSPNFVPSDYGLTIDLDFVNTTHTLQCARPSGCQRPDGLLRIGTVVVCNVATVFFLTHYV